MREEVTLIDAAPVTRLQPSRERTLRSRPRRKSTNPKGGDGNSEDPNHSSRLDSPRSRLRRIEHVLAQQEEALNGVAKLLERPVKDQDQAQLETHDIRETVTSQGMKPPARSPYQDMVRRIRQLVSDHVPRYATMVVASKGDPELVALKGRVGWHFPANRAGQYAGYHPACGLAAIAQLESLRAQGGEFFLLPATAYWWLEHYPALKLHLDQYYQLFIEKKDTCRIYALRALSPGILPITAAGQMARLISEFQDRFGRPPSILDWNSELKLPEVLPNLSIVRREVRHGALPYLNGSIDIVLVAPGDQAVSEEARRVAAAAVIEVGSHGTEHKSNLTVQWICRAAKRKLPSFSIIVPCFNGRRLTEACLESLIRTLPTGLKGQVIVVDDASTDDTPEALIASCADPRIKTVRNASNLGFVDSCNRGAREASGEILIFLNNDVVALPGWLPPLLRLFSDFPNAGAVGGKLIFPDGLLQEAGGVVFCDGSAMNFGRGETQLDAPLYNYVREVDYCSGALLATPRALFEQLDGFDPQYRPGYYEDTDYCFRVHATGLQVFYQPESAVVHREGGTAGLDPLAGMKQHQAGNRSKFVARWRQALSLRPPPPSKLDERARQALALNHPGGAQE